MSNGLHMKYFVLKPRGDFNDPYAKASRAALKAYAETIIDENPDLYASLEKWRIEEQGRANQTDLQRRIDAGEIKGVEPQSDVDYINWHKSIQGNTRS